MSILLDIDVTVGPHEACHRIGLSDKNKSKNTIIRHVNHRYAKKALINRKKLDDIDNAKYDFDGRTKIFIENLSPANISIAYNCRKLRCVKITDSCYSGNGIICIKNTANSKLEKIHHVKEL